MANITNIVGKKTNDYINSIKGNKTMKQLTLSTKPETTETKIAKTVSRKINGIVKKLTPTENFIRQSNYRLNILDKQFEQLGKMVGNNYERTDGMIDVIEIEILNMASKALDDLRNPKTAIRLEKDFTAKLRKA